MVLPGWLVPMRVLDPRHVGLRVGGSRRQSACVCPTGPRRRAGHPSASRSVRRVRARAVPRPCHVRPVGLGFNRTCRFDNADSGLRFRDDLMGARQVGALGGPLHRRGHRRGGCRRRQCVVGGRLPRGRYGGGVALPVRDPRDGPRGRRRIVGDSRNRHCWERGGSGWGRDSFACRRRLDNLRLSGMRWVDRLGRRGRW